METDVVAWYWYVLAGMGIASWRTLYRGAALLVLVLIGARAEAEFDRADRPPEE